MTFPETRPTLILRIVTYGEHEDWRQFLDDYWGPICRFARRCSGLSNEDAEDVAADVFKAILNNRLLERWSNEPTAKLRTLLCQVARNLMSNRARVQQGRRTILKRIADSAGSDPNEPTVEEHDMFFAAWVDEVLQQAMSRLLRLCYEADKGDHVRVLYGRVCDGLAVKEVAEALGISPSQVGSYYRACREQLERELHRAVRVHVERYSQPHDVAEEYRLEWGRLGEFLKRNGGLEAVLKRCHEDETLARRVPSTVFHETCEFTLHGRDDVDNAESNDAG